MKRIGEINPVAAGEKKRQENLSHVEAEKRKIQAAVKSGLLRVGDYYSLEFSMQLESKFWLMGPEYGDAMWFEAAMYVPDELVRKLPHERPLPGRKRLARRLYNEALYRRVWGHGLYGPNPDAPA